MLKVGFTAGNFAVWLRLKPQGWELILKARILALRLISGPQSWDKGVEAEIWASRLVIGP